MQSVQQVQNAQLNPALNNKREREVRVFVIKRETRVLTQEHEARVSKCEVLISNVIHETSVSIKEHKARILQRETHVPTKGREARVSNAERKACVLTSRGDACRPEQPHEPPISNAKCETRVHETRVSESQREAAFTLQ